MHFRLYLKDASGHIQGVEERAFQSDLEAVTWAFRFPYLGAKELWEAGRLITQFGAEETMDGGRGGGCQSSAGRTFQDRPDQESIERPC